MARKAVEILTAWANANGAVYEFWLGSLQPHAVAVQARTLSRIADIVGTAISTSTKAVLAAQTDVARACAERVAADPRATKLVVESAHQAYDLVAAYAEAGAETCDAWLAAVRCADPLGDRESVSTE